MSYVEEKLILKLGEMADMTETGAITTAKILMPMNQQGRTSRALH
jgi:hypothetical protein